MDLEASRVGTLYALIIYIPLANIILGIANMPVSIDTMLILGLIVLLLVLGPSKLPQFARAIGEAVREFRRASSALSEEPPPQREAPKTQQPQQAQQPAQAEVDTSNAIVAAAIKEGIDVRGKSIDQIAEELAKKLREKKAASTSHM